MKNFAHRELVWHGVGSDFIYGYKQFKEKDTIPFDFVITSGADAVKEDTEYMYGTIADVIKIIMQEKDDE